MLQLDVHPRITSTMHDNHTFPKAMTPINIQFRVAGLVPDNIDVFEIVISCRQRRDYSKPVNNTTPEY